MSDLKNKCIYSPAILIEYKGYPINRFTAEVYNSKGEIFDKYHICHRDNIHSAYHDGYKKLKEAMVLDGTIYRMQYDNGLYEYATRKHFKSRIKQSIYGFYLWVGRLF